MRMKCWCFCSIGDVVELKDRDPHLLTGTLKLYLRELSDPLIPIAFYDRFVQICQSSGPHFSFFRLFVVFFGLFCWYSIFSFFNFQIFQRVFQTTMEEDSNFSNFKSVTVFVSQQNQTIFKEFFHFVTTKSISKKTLCVLCHLLFVCFQVSKFCWVVVILCFWWWCWYLICCRRERSNGPKASGCSERTSKNYSYFSRLHDGCTFSKTKHKTKLNEKTQKN